MYAQTRQPKENKSRTVAKLVSQKKSSVKQGIGFVDNQYNLWVSMINSFVAVASDRVFAAKKCATNAT